MHRTNKYSEHSSIIWSVWPNGWVFVCELSGSWFESSWSHSNFRFHTCLQQEFHQIEVTIECGFTLKSLREMIRTYSEVHRTDKYSGDSFIVCSVWPNARVFVYELSGSRFECSCSHLKFRYGACFHQGFPSHSGKYRVWIHCGMRKSHDKKIQSSVPYKQVLKTQPNHLVSLANWMGFCLQAKWFWVPFQLLLVKSQISRLLRARSSMILTKL